MREIYKPLNLDSNRENGHFSVTLLTSSNVNVYIVFFRHNGGQFRDEQNLYNFWGWNLHHLTQYPITLKWHLWGTIKTHSSAKKQRPYVLIYGFWYLGQNIFGKNGLNSVVQSFFHVVVMNVGTHCYSFENEVISDFPFGWAIFWGFGFHLNPRWCVFWAKLSK